jgi:hypothetical protein
MTTVAENMRKDRQKLEEEAPCVSLVSVLVLKILLVRASAHYPSTVLVPVLHAKKSADYSLTHVTSSRSKVMLRQMLDAAFILEL